MSGKTSVHRECVKKGTFLHDYLRYNDPTETPVAYDFWTGMWLLSAAVGRRACVPRPLAPVFLNLYIVLCADAGVTRKSSSLRRCEGVFTKAGLSSDCYTVTGNTTAEAINLALSEQTNERGTANMCVLASELVTVLGREKYTASLAGLLTDLYDCPNERIIDRASSGAQVLRNVCVNLLGASTAAWLVRSMNPDIIEGGFTSRCLFVIDENRKRRVAWPEASPDDAAVVSRLCDRLQDVRRQAQSLAQVPLTPKAIRRFKDWYDSRRTDDADSYVTSFEAREDHHVLRAAALLAINDNTWVVDAWHVHNAIKLIATHKKSAANLLGYGKEVKRLVVGVDRLRETLAQAGDIGLKQTDLVFKMRYYLRTQELIYTLMIMHELEMIQRFEVRTSGRAATIWRGTNKLLIRDLNELLRKRLTGL